MTIYGGIESGGSKWECAIATGPADVRAATTIPTTTPDETLGRAVDFFLRAGPVAAIGIGSFGPVDTRADSKTWWFITTTPKPGWANTDVGQEIRRRLDVPVAFDTDVNAAALGEHRWVRAAGCGRSGTSRSGAASEVARSWTDTSCTAFSTRKSCVWALAALKLDLGRAVVLQAAV